MHHLSIARIKAVKQFESRKEGSNAKPQGVAFILCLHRSAAFTPLKRETKEETPEYSCAAGYGVVTEFRQELLDQMAARRGKWTYGEELCESAEQKAERLVKTPLRQRGWKETDLAKRRKGRPGQNQNRIVITGAECDD